MVSRRLRPPPFPRGGRPWTLGEGMLVPETSYLGLRPLVPFPSFRQRQVCYDKDVILPRMCTYCSTIKRNSTSAPRQTNSRFLFPISDKVSYAPGQSNCLYSDTVLPSSPSARTLNSVSSYKHRLDCLGT